jgi:hypothetical protein
MFGQSGSSDCRARQGAQPTFFRAHGQRNANRGGITSFASPPEEQEHHAQHGKLLQHAGTDGQHAPIPPYRPGLFILTNIGLIAARRKLLILKSGEPPFDR